MYINRPYPDKPSVKTYPNPIQILSVNDRLENQIQYQSTSSFLSFENRQTEPLTVLEKPGADPITNY